MDFDIRHDLTSNDIDGRRDEGPRIRLRDIFFIVTAAACLLSVIRVTDRSYVAFAWGAWSFLLIVYFRVHSVLLPTVHITAFMLCLFAMLVRAVFAFRVLRLDWEADMAFIVKGLQEVAIVSCLGSTVVSVIFWPLELVLTASRRKASVDKRSQGGKRFK